VFTQFFISFSLYVLSPGEKGQCLQLDGIVYFEFLCSAFLPGKSFHEEETENRRPDSTRGDWRCDFILERISRNIILWTGRSFSGKCALIDSFHHDSIKERRALRFKRHSRRSLGRHIDHQTSLGARFYSLRMD